MIWNLLWSVIAVDQIQTTITLFQPKSIYGEKVVIEKNGTKFLVSPTHPDAQFTATEDSNCKDDDLWEESFDYEFDYQTSKLFIEFTGKPNELEKINSLIIKQSPSSFSMNQAGFDYLNYKKTKFELNNNKAEIDIQLYKSQFESDYPVDLIFEAYGQGDSKTELCSISRFLSLHVNNYEQYKKPQSFYIDNIFSFVDLTSPVIKKGIDSEMKYIAEFVDKSSLNLLNKTLPVITEETIALLHAYVDRDYNLQVTNNIYLEPITDEVVIGLFGDVQEEDLKHLELLINTLRVVAPALKITYTKNADLVTLPIHFSKCTEEFSEKFNDCYRAKWGFYVSGIYPEHGWIWVDSSLSKLTRQNVLTHEIGHALGLSHNLCHNSVMSYSEFADHQANYFTHIDLMMLQAIYDPGLPNQKNAIHTGIIVDYFDLDRKKIEKLKNDIPSTCHRQPQAYDFLVQMQKGNN